MDDQHVKRTIPHAGKTVKIIPTFSEIYDKVQSAALGYSADWTKAGAGIQMIDSKGATYDGTKSLDRYGLYRVSQLPITDEPFNLEVRVPGHFVSKKPIGVGIVTPDYSYGQLFFNDILRVTPGDINQDDVIDIHDAISIQEHWASGDRSADINFDGKVDRKDMMFIVKSYLMKNPDANDAPEPQPEHNGKTLEHILAELEIE